MERFVSSFRNKVDGKGRVSVPAVFRGVLARQGHSVLYAYPSPGAPALDCGGQRLIDEISVLLEGLPPYSDERDLLSVELFGRCEELRVDGDGRIVLPDDLRAHAGIEGEAVMVGLGHKFQIWEPGRFEARRSESAKRVGELRGLLGRETPVDR
ncbi:MAG: division/cell wall cluster transcriptional repressor MraZ [Rhodobiaceae bacterium]|nr:division/cell wall cluster transcriptional repressor MraZ [Rhodobiaceae bacterium]MCC0019118.1 division/cell wall cluster transcriptional repressor MraZ [Rhodobiaceae bacterium]MCC0061081.1 division/cell wall cluster transcriptional repressor MraZ [Rhodobiaceae bacterium]